MAYTIDINTDEIIDNDPGTNDLGKRLLKGIVTYDGVDPRSLIQVPDTKKLDLSKPSQTRKAPVKKKPPTKVVKSKKDLEEEFKVIEIPIIMKEYEEWIKNNPGKEFREFLKELEYIRKQDEQKYKDIVLAGALGKIDDAMSGIMSMAMGGIIRDPSYTYYSDGGSANKPKDPTTKIKKLNLADYFQYGMKIADLTESEREVVNDLLKKSFGKNYSDN